MDRFSRSIQVVGDGVDAVAVAELIGFVDGMQAQEFKKAIDEAIQEANDAGNGRLILNMNGLEYINSAGLGIVVYAHRRFPGNGKVCLAEVPDKILQPIQLVGVKDMISVYDSVDEALEAVRE